MLCSQPYLKLLKAEGHAPPELRLIFAMLSAVSVSPFLGSDTVREELNVRLYSYQSHSSGWGGLPCLQRIL